MVEASGAPVQIQETERLGLDGRPHRRLIIEGKCLVCDTLGINGRKYPKPIMAREVERLRRTKLPAGRLAAELNHPRLNQKNIPLDYSIMEQNLWKTCAVIEDLWMDGDVIYCRMVVAEGTPAGDCLAGLIRTGYHPGFSIRGAGTAHPINEVGDSEVDEDYELITVDVVGNPSYGDEAIFNSYMEAVSKKENYGILLESVGNFRREVRRNIKIGFGKYDRRALVESLTRSRR